MKHKLSTFLLVLLIFLLLVGIGLFGYVIYTDLQEPQSNQITGEDGDSVAIESSKNETSKIANNISQIFTTDKKEELTYSSETSSGKYFYEQLDDTEKSIYNGLQENKNNLATGNYVIQYGSQFSDILKQENGGTILGNKYQAAIDAFTADNPDLFYIEVSKLYINIETSKKAFSTSYNVYIGPEDGKNYYSESFTNEAQVREAIEQVEKIKNIVVGKMTNSQYKNIKIIHDYIVDTLKYDENYESKNTYTIYGALIEHKCVCEGYAKSLKYIANAVGIPCEIIKGTATNSTGVTEKHAWNCINLNNKWYYMDVTWDDPIVVSSENGESLSTTSYKYFLKGAKNFQNDHISENTFSTSGKEFTYPEMSQTDY